MSKGSSRRGRKQKTRSRRTSAAAAAKSLAELAEHLGRIADDLDALFLGLGDPEVDRAVDKAVEAMWTAESRLKGAVDMLGPASDALQAQTATGGES